MKHAQTKQVERVVVLHYRDCSCGGGYQFVGVDGLMNFRCSASHTLTVTVDQWREAGRPYTADWYEINIAV